MTIGEDLLARGDNHPVISFTNEDFIGIQPHQDDPMVIEMTMVRYKVQRVLVDQGSSTDVLSWNAIEKLQISHEWLLPFSGSLIGFAGNFVEVRGYVNLLTTFRDKGHEKVVWVKYLVINAPSSYNIIIGRATLNALGAIVSTVHLTMKYPLRNGAIEVIKADQEATRRCY
ncbi:Aspartic peptidase domain superfamily [Sesbania bispinosa]|nr:Aspartic peptidase domain superfamily [Sesbania bispinosa]